LLNIVAEVHGSTGDWAHRPFDKEDSEDRTLLFRALSTAYQNHAFQTPHPTLGQLNKVALREVHTQLLSRAASSVSKAAPHHFQTSPSTSTDTTTTTTTPPPLTSEQRQGIRDLQTHTRANPTTFLERPKDSVAADSAAVSSSEASFGVGGGGQCTDVNTALEHLEAQRTADDPKRRTTHIDFTTLDGTTIKNAADRGGPVDNSDVKKRLEELEKSRLGTIPLTDPPSGVHQLPRSAESTIAEAMTTFAKTADTLDQTVAAESSRRQDDQNHENQRFKMGLGSTVPSPESPGSVQHTNTTHTNVPGESRSTADALLVNLDAGERGGSSSSSSSSNSHQQQHHSSDSSRPAPLTAAQVAGRDTWTGATASGADDTTASSTRFESDLELLNHSTPSTPPDTCAFQQSLQLDSGLDDRHLFRTQDMRENMIIKPRHKYTTHKHYLEVSSADRNRTISSEDDPYAFTVHFGSDQPGFRVVPVFDVHPTEDPDDHHTLLDDDPDCAVPERIYNLQTTQIRSKLGLGGIPTRNSAPVITLETLRSTNLEYKTLHNCNTNSRANVDTVYHNILALQTNYVQLYLPFQELSRIPYVLLEVSQFTNMYNSTNNTVRKSFCKLFYDRSTSPTSTSNMHVFVPLNNERKMFVTPVASVDRLTFALYTPSGHSLSHLCSSDGHGMDVFRVVNFSGRAGADGGADQLCIEVSLREGQVAAPIQPNDCLHFDCVLEWYNQQRWSDWVSATGAGNAELNRFEELEEEYAEQLHAHQGTSLETLQKLREDYERKQVRFSYPLDPSTPEQQKLHDFVTGPAGLLVQEVDGNMVYVNLPGTISLADVSNAMSASVLLYAAMYNTSNSTNISMTVWTREEEDVVMASNV